MLEAATAVRALFDAVNARDQEALEALCDQRVEILLLPVEAGGRADPYLGHRGLRELFIDATAAWEQLVLTPGELQARDEVVLVAGRVHTRSRELGLRDLPVAWVFRSRDGRIASARVYPDVEAAMEAAGTTGAANGASA
jgi:ketosteroid isomerase-like protein